MEKRVCWEVSQVSYNIAKVLPTLATVKTIPVTAEAMLMGSMLPLSLGIML